MDTQNALLAFDSLSQETRLKAFRILVENGITGVAAGELSEQLDVPHNTLSFHLSHMAKAGLVTSQKQGRSVIYKANLMFIQNLILFLVDNCCGEDFSKTAGKIKGNCNLDQLSQCC